MYRHKDSSLCLRTQCGWMYWLWHSLFYHHPICLGPFCLWYCNLDL